MKPKTLRWINPRPEIHMNSDEIPQVLYRIHQIETGPIYGLFFYHGYTREYDAAFITKGSNVDELKEIAQKHWDNYVYTIFME